MIISGNEFPITVCVGVSIYPFEGNDADTLIKYAAMAVSAAKQKGRNKVVFNTADIKNINERKTALTAGLYSALENNEFYLLYQPQINMITGKMEATEALLRWKSDKFGLVFPSEFVPIIEQMGIINQVGLWIIETALKQTKKWQFDSNREFGICINISVVQLRARNFFENVLEIVDRVGISHESIEFEITENVTEGKNEHVFSVLNRFFDAGFKIALDDFGTEYSSLSRLKMLPINRIKIDKIFIDGIGGSEKDEVIIKNIMHLSKNLGLGIIAEGVETKIQKDFLKEVGCYHAQGYYYYKPIEPEAIYEILERER